MESLSSVLLLALLGASSLSLQGCGSKAPPTQAPANCPAQGRFAVTASSNSPFPSSDLASCCGGAASVFSSQSFSGSAVMGTCSAASVCSTNSYMNQLSCYYTDSDSLSFCQAQCRQCTLLPTQCQYTAATLSTCSADLSPYFSSFGAAGVNQGLQASCCGPTSSSSGSRAYQLANCNAWAYCASMASGGPASRGFSCYYKSGNSAASSWCYQQCGLCNGNATCNVQPLFYMDEAPKSEVAV